MCVGFVVFVLHARAWKRGDVHVNVGGIPDWDIRHVRGMGSRRKADQHVETRKEARVKGWVVYGGGFCRMPLLVWCFW
jgi:hypothetical protein